MLLNLYAVVILSMQCLGDINRLAIVLAGRWDSHFTANGEGGRIEYFPPRALREVLHNAEFTDTSFNHCGRLPWLWKSMVVIA